MEMQAVKERIRFFQGHVNQFSIRLSTYLTTFFQDQVQQDSYRPIFILMIKPEHLKGAL
jgi:hypothetical protein